MDYSKLGAGAADGSNPNFLPVEEPAGYMVELYFQCRKLKDLDTFSKSDPQVRVELKETPTAATWKKVGETEVIQNNLNPDFRTTVQVFYQFEVSQTIRFQVVDSDGGSSFDLIGQVECSMAQVVGSKDFTYTANLFKAGDKNVRGQIIVRVAPIKASSMEIQLKLGGRNLTMNTTCFCIQSINPYIVIDKTYQAGGKLNYVSIHKTEVSTSQTPNPSFAPFKLKAQALCNSDLKQPIKFKFYNKMEEGEPSQLLGTVQKCIDDFVETRSVNLTVEGTGAAAGQMAIEDLKIIEKPTFLEYLRCGWGISLQVAIDFTGSNGDYTKPDSLHFLGGYNQYEHAIRSVGSILECYDSDRSFPVYGFGGVPRFMGENRVSHCFPLNGNLSNPEIVGTEGILELYRKNLQFIGLHGPTYFAPILAQIIANVTARLQYQTYSIFLIITDGEIHDMDETKRLIVDASGLPLSIIIIGVGLEKFKMMKELDADKGVLRDAHGRAAQRDIVQFVKFKKYAAAGAHVLAEKVLKEVPQQLVGYMEMKNIYPPGFSQRA